MKYDGTLLAAAALILPKFGRVGASLASHVARRNDAVIINSCINPHGYTSAGDFARDYQAISLLSKYPGLSLDVNREEVALKSFRDSERVCTEVNGWFRQPAWSFSSDVMSDLLWARRYIEGVLGVFSWDVAVQYCRFGPGASVGLGRKRSHPCQKIGNKNPTITGPCLHLFEAYRKYDRHYNSIGLEPIVVRGSVGTTVPKNAKTDRFIAIEPQLNMFFQKGIGAMIRKRLRYRGVDLDTQWVKNQELALRGSLHGDLSTLDLSGASDSLSISLVEFLLPQDWYTAMTIVRSPYCNVKGEDMLLRKFSSMGNGFTFELESLIFLALAKAATHRTGGNVHDVAAFGDDIICPEQSTSAVIGTLVGTGFKLNPSKSFWSGRFRESCGKHYFSGHDVTPFFLKKELRSPHDIMWACNSLRRAANRYNGGYTCSELFLEGYSYFLGLLPRRFRDLSCPDGYGDNAIVRDLDECSPRPKRNHNYVEGWVAKSLTIDRGKVEFDDLPALVQFFWTDREGSRASSNTVTGEGGAYARFAPGDSYRLRVTTTAYTSWTTLGPWL